MFASKELIYHEPQLSSILEQDLEGIPEDDRDPEWVDDDPAGWNELFINLVSDNED